MRNKGYASDAIRLMLEFGTNHLNLTEFIVKISNDNERSLNLFKKLGFQFLEKSKFFDETTLIFKYNPKPNPDYIPNSNHNIITDCNSNYNFNNNFSSSNPNTNYNLDFKIINQYKNLS